MEKYQILKPDYYDRFACKGPDCRNTCCKGWNVFLSEEEVRRIEQLLQGNPQMSSLDRFKRLPPEKCSKNAEFQMEWAENGKCSQLTEEGLCKLHRDYGADVLPNVCRTFPREICGWGDTYFHTLTPGCEKVLETLLYDCDKVSLASFGGIINPDADVKKIHFASGNELAEQELYFTVLNFCMVILQVEEAAFEEKLILLGIGLRQVEELIEKNREWEVQAYCDEYLRSLETIEDLSDIIPNRPQNAAVLLTNVLMPVWTKPKADEDAERLLTAVKDILGVSADINGENVRVSYSAERYEELRKEYETFMAGKEQFIENVMIAFMYYHRFPFHTSISKSVWENYMYFAWLFSTIKFTLTALMPQIHSDEDLIDCLVVILRMWGHSENGPKVVLEYLHENSCDDLAHLALLLKSC